MDELWDGRLLPADAEVIKRVARRFAGRGVFRRDDAEDLEQEVAAHVIEVSHRHDSNRGSREKFISKVAKNKLLNLAEARRAQKRGDGRDVSVECAGDGVLIDGAESSEQLDTVLDVRAAIAGLPDDLRRVTDLRALHSERELEALLGLTRGQVRARLQRIERHFRDFGLGPDF